MSTDKYQYYDSMKNATKARIDSIRVELDLERIQYLKTISK